MAKISKSGIIAKRKANNGPTPKNPSAMKPKCDYTGTPENTGVNDRPKGRINRDGY